MRMMRFLLSAFPPSRRAMGKLAVSGSLQVTGSGLLNVVRRLFAMGRRPRQRRRNDMTMVYLSNRDSPVCDRLLTRLLWHLSPPVENGEPGEN